MTVAVRTLADDVWTVLDAVANLNTYRGEILDVEGQPTDPPNDPDGRVHPYALVYFAPGQATSNRVCAIPNRTGWSFTVWCVGGDDNRALWAVDQVRAALTGRRFSTGILRETIGNAQPQRSDAVQPSRYSMPLGYSLHIPG